MTHYFDNCATTKVDNAVQDIINKYNTETYFNPSARSTYSLAIANDLADARENIAKLIGAEAYDIIFTSGGTEADNLAINGAVKSRRGGNMVVTESEHSAVYNTVAELASRGMEIRIAKTLNDGHIDVEDFVAKVDQNTVLACFMHVNNETGAVNDVKAINKLVKTVNARTVTFVDGVQAVGKISVNISDLDVDLYTFSGHKIHCCKGIGCLVKKKNVRLAPMIFGGGQEKGFRSGTENVAGAVALAKALQLAKDTITDNAAKYIEFKEIVRSSLKDIADWKELCEKNVSPSIMTLALADIKGEVLLHMLEEYELIVGTGSACSSKNKQSRQARAIGLDRRYIEGVIRLSFSKYNTKDEASLLGDKLAQSVRQLREIMRA